MNAIVVVDIQERALNRAHEGVIPTQDTGSIFYSTPGTEAKIWSTPTLKI